jgi:hypothetical protein
MIATRRALFVLAAGGLLAAAVASPALAQVVIQERVMPPLRVEVMTPIPHPGWFWVKGFWRWAPGGWAWVPGHWVAHAIAPMPAVVVETPPPPPGPRFFWVRGHWVLEGDRWIWVRGHWVR